MSKVDYVIRTENPNERREVENLVREAFWNVYRPGCSEHFVLSKLRDDEDFIQPLDLVMEQDGRIIGQIAFMRAVVKCDDGGELPVATIGPLCIEPSRQRLGYGRILLDYALSRAKEIGVGAVFLEGDAAFYGKSGFVPASEFGIRYRGLPDGADSSFFLCRELSDGYVSRPGEYGTPQVYFVNDDDVEAFDKTFPYKEKLTLPGQIF